MYQYQHQYSSTILLGFYIVLLVIVAESECSESKMVLPLGPGKFYGRSLPRPRIYNDVKFNDVRVDPPVSVMDPFLSWAEEAHWSMGGLNYKRLRLQGRIEGNVSKLRAQQEKVSKKRQMTSRDSSATGGLDSDPYGVECKVPSGSKRAASDSPPPAPVAMKRRRFMAVTEDSDDDIDSSDEELSGEAGKQVARRRLVKKLGDEFDKVASESDQTAGSVKGSQLQKGSRSAVSRTRSRKSEQELHENANDVVVVVKEVNKSISKGKGKKLSKLEGEDLSRTDGEKSSGALKTRSSPRLAKRNGSS